MTKYQLTTQAYQSTLQKVTRTPAEWMAFIESACRNYKCRFDEQILIYAQRPGATAVLEIEKWNRLFGRWVNRGAKGIAVFDDEHTGPSRLKHYFDVSDTHESRFARPVPIWRMSAEYEAEVIEHLENSFGELEDSSSFAAALISAAGNAVDDNLPDYLYELAQIRDGSFLDELDDESLEASYRVALKNSVAYMLFTRCGIDTEPFFDGSSFQNVTDFNTPQTTNALGMAASDIAESCLRGIAATVRNAEKERAGGERIQRHAGVRTFAGPARDGDNEIIESTIERSHEDGSIDIPHGERLPGAQPDHAGGDAGGYPVRQRQVRIAAQEIPETAPQDIVRQSPDELQAERTSGRDRAGGDRADGAVDGTDGGGAGRGRADESQGPDEMGGPDEQHPAGSGGIGAQRLDIRIKPMPPVAAQLDLLGESHDLQTAEDGDNSPHPPLFSISQQMMDEVLTSGGNEPNSIHRIAAWYKKDHTIPECIGFLRGEYGDGGKGFIFAGNHVSVWFNDRGIHVAVGDTALNAADASLITWEHAARRIRELFDMGRYMPQAELDKVDGIELMAIADSLWQIHHDRADGTEIPFLDAEWFKGGHPESTARIAEILTHFDQRQAIIDGLRKFSAAYSENRSLLRFPYSGKYLHSSQLRLEDLQHEPLVFTANESASTARPGFITQDEVDRVLCGEHVQHSKFRIYTYFLQGHTTKEKADFLKKEYGTGGFGRTGFNEWHDNKGIVYSRENNHMPYDKVVLPWPKVAKRIDNLIASGRYMTEQEIAHIPEYEKYELARDVVSFYPRQPEELPRPFPREADFLDSVKIVRPQLDKPERVTEILEQMAAILDNTADFDRNYAFMQGAFESLTAYQNGSYSLFTPAKPTENVQASPVPAMPVPGENPADENAVYGIELGATVYIGTDEYDIVSFDDTCVVLRDASAPLFTEEIPRAEFDRKLRENRLNDHLKKLDGLSLSTPQDANRYAKAEYPGALVLVQVGDMYLAMGEDAETVAETLGLVVMRRDDERVECNIPSFRLYECMEALEDGGHTVVIAGKTEAGYEVRSADPARQPGYEEWSEPATAENAPDRPGEPSDDVAAYMPADNDPASGLKSIVIDLTPQHEPVKDMPAENEPPPNAPVWEEIEGGEVTHVRFDLMPKSSGPVELERLTPSWEQARPRSRAQTFDAHPEIPQSSRQNYRITDDALGAGGQKTKFKNNIAAIQVLQAVETETRFATPEEQEVLARYVGWGGLPQAFDPENATWADEYAELAALLSPEEWKSARESTINAHYTSPTVIKAMYKAIENMGRRDGLPASRLPDWNILEPSCGIGNFLGLLPESMATSKLFGVEIDGVTGRIARQLYQKNSIAIQGFEDTDLPDSFFDVAIGNVPFGEYKLSDKRYDKHNFLIHDYFFARTLDKVRPGGVIAFVTSKGTMDKKNPAVRKYIAQRAELLGAIRLPNTAFKANAGTQVTADIIFLQKRDRIVDIEPDWVHLGQIEDVANPGETIPVNSYFAEHPDMILGTMARDDMMYGNKSDTTCNPFPDSDLAAQLDEAVTNIHAEITEYELDGDELEEDTSIPADPNVRNFSYTIVDGQIYYRQDSRMVPVELPVTTQNRVRGLIDLRDCARTLIAYQTENWPDSDIKAEQTRLNRLYDAFTKKYGLINSRGNSMAFSQDSAYCLLCSLEILDENGELERKADMFTKRTIKARIPVTHVDTATEALAVSMSENAKVDLPFMAALTGMEPQGILDELGGIIFQIPQQGEPVWVTAEEYLSGNIREKLAVAKEYAAEHPEFEGNVRALENAMPQDLTAGEIAVRLGATWLPEDVVQQFMYELLGTPPYARERIKIFYSHSMGQWNVTEKSYDRSNINAFNTYGTKRANAYKILEDSLNLRDVRVWDKVYDPDERRVINKKETAIAQAKQELIRQKFSEWIWQDPDRRERLCRLYNDTFNSIRPREYSGSHLTFPGMNPEISLRKHQVDAIAHILYGGNTLLAHEVGAGKTYEMVAAAMEMKRLGLCNKSLIVVPNHITEQWAAEWLQLYPSANILVATKKDFETRNRKKFCARIATGEYDAVIIGHSQFEKIPMSVERQVAMLEKQISDIISGIAEVKRNNGEKFTIKQMMRLQKSLEARLKKLNDQTRKDDVVTFEELGVDRLFVDEAHYYKNLYLTTKMRNVGGIAQTEAQKSSDLFMKCRYLDELTEGRGTVFATGTPISNSMVELYTMQRYLQYAELERSGLQHFDSWASTFGETVTAIELAPEGSGYRAKTRFARFYNLPELMSTFKMAADIQTADMLNLPVPKANFHNVVLKPSEWQKDMVAQLAERAEEVRGGNVDPSVDNMLKITNDGRKLALDQRLINPMLPDDPEGKAAVCAGNVFRIWEETKPGRSTQMVFCDLSTPKGDGTFNVYEDIRARLIEKGVPDEEIAFIHHADTETKKKELFAKVRKGQVRVLLGSTQKMGAGTNAQDRLIALHDLDCPWRPSDLAQRLGRIVRQGNKNPEVDIFRYVTESTFDSYLYQLVENKQRFIAQVMTSKTPVRVAEDVDETALSYAEIKALATGNPLIIEKCQLEMDVNKLKLLHASHLSQRYSLEDMILKEYPQEIKEWTARAAGYKADAETTARHPSDKDHFPAMKIGGNLYAEKADAGKAVIEACKAMTSPDPVPLGEYRGFQMILSFDSFSKEYHVTLAGALSHTVTLGTDIHGNIARLDNALEGFAGAFKKCEGHLEEVQAQLKTAQGEVLRPFAQEQELLTKSERLRQVNSMLNMDEKDNTVFEAEPDEGDVEPAPKVAGLER